MGASVLQRNLQHKHRPQPSQKRQPTNQTNKQTIDKKTKECQELSEPVNNTWEKEVVVIVIIVIVVLQSLSLTRRL